MRRAFSLIELLVVIAIIAVMTTLAMPSISGIMSGAKINLGIEMIAGSLSTARHRATAKNCDVEIRLITMKDPSFLTSGAEIRAIQVLEKGELGLKAVEKARLLPSGIIIGQNTAMSSLAGLPSIEAAAGDLKLPGVGMNYSYRAFRIRPNGSLDLESRLPSPQNDQYFVTIYDEKSPPSGAVPPANFATIQLHPVTGTHALYRP